MTELSWIANYSDGTTLTQYADGKETKYSDIDRERLTRFDLINQETNKPVYSLYLREGQKLIWRRRVLKHLNDQPDTIIILVGWQMTVMTGSGPRTIIAINYIHEDGSIALDGPRSNLELYQFEL